MDACHTTDDHADKFPEGPPPRQTQSKPQHHHHQITGPTGSVRGHRDAVRLSLERLRRLGPAAAAARWAPQQLPGGRPPSAQEQGRYLRELEERDRNSCVLYTTTLGVVRDTFEASRKMRNILQLNLIAFEERDIYLSAEYREQLRLRCGGLLRVPNLFVEGQHFGGLRALDRANETAELRQLLAAFKLEAPERGLCGCCGNARFIACPACHGSQRTRAAYLAASGVALRCTRCHSNAGLVRCPRC